MRQSNSTSGKCKRAPCLMAFIVPPMAVCRLECLACCRLVWILLARMRIALSQKELLVGKGMVMDLGRSMPGTLQDI